MSQFVTSSSQAGPPAHLVSQVERSLGCRSTAWSKPDTGLSAAHRYSVMLEDGRSAFVKAATDADTEGWLRTERRALELVGGHLGPRILASLEDDGVYPVLITEDLRHAHWPASHQGVNWRPGDIELVLAAVRELSAIEAPSDLGPTRAESARTWTEPGAREAVLGLCSAAWLDGSLHVLDAAARALDRSGISLVHGDIRSDNICILNRRAMFVDWSNAARGSGELDLAELLPTLHLEGGPEPFSVMPGGGSWAAASVVERAFFAIERTDAPGWLQRVIRRLAGLDLEWAAASLGLPPPDGPSWRSV